jgi:DnaJ-class molecular chaperone
MPTGEICRLAEMAGGKDVDSLVNLALFCAGRGSYRDYVKARGRIMTAGRAGEDPLARFGMRFEGLKRKGGGVRAPGPPRGKREPSGKDAGDPGIAAAGRKGIEPPEPPKTIDAECLYCKGSGMITSIGCTRCAGGGASGSEDCPDCRGSGRIDYVCRQCEGRRKLVYGGKTIECPPCRGKGRPACRGCKGTGSLKASNPDASPVLTATCPACDGRRFLTVKCKRCGGKGSRTVTKLVSDFVFTTYTAPCVFCDGKGTRAPVCPGCGGKGYVGSRKNPDPCARCSGTGDVFFPCRTCAGRGWIPTKTKK